MKKRLLGLLAMSLFVIPLLTQSAETKNPEDFLPGDAIMWMDVSLSGRLKELLGPFLTAESLPVYDTAGDNQSKEKAKAEVLIDQLKSGATFSISLSGLENFLFSFPVSPEQWDVLIAESEKETHETTDIYLENTYYLAYIGGNVVIAGLKSDLEKVIDRAEGKRTDSASANESYKKMTESFLSPRMLGLVLDVEKLVSLFEDTLKESLGSDVGVLSALKKFFSFEGISIAETEKGYGFTINIAGNPQGLSEAGVSMNSGGDLKEGKQLFRVFPSAKPILYSESNNPKANYEDSKKMTAALFEELGEDPLKEFYDELGEALGVSIDEMYAAFEEEFALGVQYDERSPLPYITVMARVEKTADKAKKLTADLVEGITKFLKEEDVPKAAYKISEKDGLTKFSFDITKLAEDYDGPPFPKVSFVAGVTSDNLFIISNFTGIEDAEKRTGFGQDPDFAAYPQAQQTTSGIIYLNVRNIWGMFDSALEWVEDIADGENGPPLDFYQGYYAVIEKLYSWKDVMIISHATETDATVEGFVTIDDAKHLTYQEFLDDFKEKDTDDDGVSDYEERYLYHTSVDSADCDKDGESDIDELRSGRDPCKDERLFNDVGDDAYYTDEVAFLHEKGAISGYSDDSFRPGQAVNRAEFVAMIVKTFEENTSAYLGVEVSLKNAYSPFADVDYETWYYDPISKAYAAGFIAGSRDPESGELIFRPGDTITRAEALAILNKASKALSKSRDKVSCSESPFEDVSEEDWFCGAVANGYANGITKGRRADAFDPYGTLNRAEAAVMIRRTLEKDVEIVSSQNGSLIEIAAPLLPSLSGGGEATIAAPSETK